MAYIITSKGMLRSKRPRNIIKYRGTEYSIRTLSNEIDLPKSLIAVAVNEVVAREIPIQYFYMILNGKEAIEIDGKLFSKEQIMARTHYVEHTILVRMRRYVKGEITAKQVMEISPHQQIMINSKMAKDLRGKPFKRLKLANEKSENLIKEESLYIKKPVIKSEQKARDSEYSLWLRNHKLGVGVSHG